MIGWQTRFAGRPAAGGPIYRGTLEPELKDTNLFAGWMATTSYSSRGTA